MTELRREHRWGIMQKPRNGEWSSCTINAGYALEYATERVEWLNRNSKDGSEFAVFDRFSPN